MGEFSYRHAKQKAYSISSPFVFQTLPRLAAAIIRSGSYVTIESATDDRSRLGVGQFSDWVCTVEYSAVERGQLLRHIYPILPWNFTQGVMSPRIRLNFGVSPSSSHVTEQRAFACLEMSTIK